MSKKQDQKVPSVKDLLQAPHDRRSWMGGTKCKTCSHDRADEIRSDIEEFSKAKNDGHPMPWSVFIKRRLIAEYGLKIKSETILHHIRSCLNILG